MVTSCLLIEMRLVGRVLEHDLADVGVDCCGLALGFGRQVDVDALLRRAAGPP